MNEEVLAGIRVLVAVAKVDGRLHDNEETAIKNALAGADLGAEVTSEALLLEAVDLDRELEKITSRDVRRFTYEAACAMVYVDGEADESERAVLEKIRGVWGVDRPLSSAQRLKRSSGQDWLPSSVTPISDPAIRDEEIDGLVLRACVRAAIFGAIPIPFVGEFLVSLVGITAIQSIGAMYGHKRDAAFWKAFAGNFVGATAARIAVLSLMKLVPGWGSVVGASGAYASTWAMARATRHYFEKGASMDPAALRTIFEDATREGTERAQASSADIEAEQARIAAVKERLDAELEEGGISEEEYAEQLAKA